MSCPFVKKQKVKSNITGRIHVVTGIRRDPPRERTLGWGTEITQDVFIQVDNQRDRNGQPLWQGWGCFREV
ncbi:hypothetical protein KKH39_03800 [Patescibacteria group bacterium]|nr:hypothetical protein [Patescibacteria group bacterium]